ncbi:MAG: efflux RND transporter permease subunit [Verrucomicrobiota bacterium]|nr:efflux RND transporter permease subunit [Verrucomicrobiota bacterium]
MQTSEIATEITRVSLNRKVTVFVLFLTILAIGFIAVNRLPLEKYPADREGHYMRIRTGWSSGVPEEAMEKIGLPMEEELSTVRGIESIDTRASQSSSEVSLRFKRDTDMDVAYREVRDRMERASLRFPDGVDDYRIYKYGGTSSSVCRMSVRYTDDTDLYNNVEKHIVRPLQRIDGVADVSVRIYRKEIIIELDKDRAEAYGLSISRLSQRLRGDNFTLSSGTVIDGGKKYLLKSSSTFHSMQDLGNIPLSDSVYLRDVATIKYEVDDTYQRTERWNKMRSARVEVFKESEANTVEVGNKVAAAIDGISKNPKLAQYELYLYQNYGEIIKRQLNSLTNNGLYGAIMAGFVLFFFLRQFRLTLIIALGIPLALFISMTVMYFAGDTLNMTSILGLVICVGLLVDNSVVVAENIHRHLQSGLSRKDACIKGVGEIGLAITTATLTTIIVFLPSLLVGGEMRFMLYQLALPVVSALLASLGIAIIFIPLCVYLTVGSDRKDEPFTSRALRGPFAVLSLIKKSLLWLYTWTFEQFNIFYNRALKYYLNRRLDLAFILIVLLSATYFYGFKKIEVVGYRDDDRDEFHMRVRFPEHFTIAQKNAYFQQVENIVETNKLQFGISSYRVEFDKHTRAEFEANYSDEGGTEDIPKDEVPDRLYKMFPEIPGVRVYYSGMDTGGEKRNDQKSRHHIKLVGDDARQLEEVGEMLKPAFAELPGVLSVEDKDSDEGPNEMALMVDRDRASSIGISPEAVAGVVSSALRGRSLADFSGNGRQIPVRMRFSEEDRAELDDINNYRVMSDDGRYSSIGALTKPAMLNSETHIQRSDKKISYYISMKLESGEESEARRAIYEAQRNIDLPEGVSFSEMKVTFDDDEISTSLIAMGLSIIFIYMLIAFLFESILMPLSIILTIPLAAIGSIWLHFSNGTEIDDMGIVGGILLMGVVVNNGIVLVDYANRLRAGGMARNEALLLANRHRFRPIVMTAFTTIFGMIPLTLASSEAMGRSFESFGFMIIGGMTTATFFTLLAVPVFYTLIDDAQKAIQNILASVLDSSQKLTFK